MAEVAAVGWAISTLGWIASPITTRLLNHGFDLLGFDESEKLRDLEERLLPRLELMRQQAERIPPEQRGRVEQWARRLKSAFYDAEDILDVADYHRLKKQVMSQSGTKSAIITINRVKQIAPGKNRKLKNALKKLENIIEEGSQLLSPLASTINLGSSSNDISDPANSADRITTTSSPTGFIIGRDKERDEIIRMLHESTSVCEPTSSNSKCYSVIGVYGIAGSGKTTLAQHVCTFERTKNYFKQSTVGGPIPSVSPQKKENYFSPIMWVHVNQIFNVNGIYRQMLEAEKVQCLDGIAVDDIPVVARLLSREGFSSLRMLSIEESDELREEEILQQFPSLTGLHFNWCNWSSLPENLGTLPQLQRLFLQRCPNVRSLPTLPISLRHFTLLDCDESFMKSCQTAGDPNWQKIAHVPRKEFPQ